MRFSVFLIFISILFSDKLKAEAEFDSKPRMELNGFSAPYLMETGDLNNDGKTDLIISTGDRVQIFYQKANKYSFPADKEILIEKAGSCKAGDFDHDGKTDLAVMDKKRKLHIFLGQEELSSDHVSENYNQFENNLAAGKIGNSGIADFLIGPTWRRWNGDNKILHGYFAGPSQNDNGHASLADLNCDETDEIIFINRPPNNLIRIYYGPFQGPFPGTNINSSMASLFIQFAPTPAPVTQIITADVNDDARLDIIAAGNNGNIFLYYQNAPIDFSNDAAPSKIISGIKSNAFIAAADMNNDKLIDLMIAEKSSGNISILYKQKNKPFPASVTPSERVISVKNKISAFQTVDIDGDNVPEIIVGTAKGNEGSILVFKKNLLKIK